MIDKDKYKAIDAQRLAFMDVPRMVRPDLLTADQLRELFDENDRLKRDNERLKELVAKYVDIAAVGQLTLLETISTNVISPR
jgi:hypothetical protein